MQEHQHQDAHAEPCNQNRLGCGLLGLELASIGHGEASVLNDGVYPLTDLGHQVSEVRALGDIERHDRLALRVLAGDEVARALRPDICNIARGARWHLQLAA